MRWRSAFSLSGVTVVLLAVMSSSVLADSPTVVLHEYIPVDPKDDLALLATTSDGSMPAAIETPSGIVAAPETDRGPSSTDKAYSGSSTARGGDNIYVPDRDTRRPNVNQYDDPFSPSITPYKRLRAYDTVLDDFSLSVADPRLRAVPFGGPVLPGEDGFFADMTVDISPGGAVRIPSVGAGARIVKRSTVPPVQIDILHDGADNWFARGTVETRTRLILEIAVPRDAFGGALRDMPKASLPPVAALPAHVARAADEVIRHLGLSRSESLRVTVAKMVAYFRGFESSDTPPRGRENVYLDLALSKKGVCRHRAYAFLITALALGIPARMIVNEAHAWVEVNDGTGFRRLDLGGAANHLDDRTSQNRIAHQQPADSFPWPSTRDSGAQLAESNRGAAQAGPTSSPASSSPSPLSFSSASSLPSRGNAAPAATLVVASSESKVMRGSTVTLNGLASISSGGCSHIRIDVHLVEQRGGHSHSIGALSTDESGHFSGSIVVPMEIPVGEYTVSLSTPGDEVCGAGKTSTSD
jgi:hypothetical protein